ncbi:MAG TPA: DUF3775 domain-containing protein [Geminicoccaceae bacterium]|nr:DUF3775 domain-containing protein [Geminicoccaceae bacterium]
MEALNQDTVCQIILHARAFDVKVEPVIPESASNPSDDDARGILEDRPDDLTGPQLRALIEDLDEEQQIELVALAWVGRGSFGRDEWGDALAEARRAHNDRTAEYLMGMPLLGDYLAEGLAEFGLSCAE